MRITVTFDDALYRQAMSLAVPGIATDELFHEVFQTFVRVQSAKRLAALGGNVPELTDIARRRGQPAE
ncbi:type II toxin-antitoxin system VapB family antitoxin [Hydrogenophaga taeniospiralis]|uniref:type II toxin-antitoxin system VapB family antitoxin n=1 Tax=Hydrogenophaga taeniospiralis TaxID=65656 RepID=UPI001CFBD36C|nr:type II toxin-antitoxin system VapB family antitoxin [Hydrogenophaga taeniospiralis]UCU95851.1 type II toxin-antitoxin system VapB family antitoxin [Hydrogenophaga taeniospiralis]